MMDRQRARNLLLLLLLAATAPLMTGYHIGFDDQAIWLPAIKKCLSPDLYPFDSSFFLSQTRFSVFPQLVAFAISSSHLPLDLCVFLWYLLTIYLVLLGSWQLAQLCFPSPTAQWAAVATVWAARLTPVAGTHLSLMDMYLHPRDLALGAILFAIVAGLSHSPVAFAWFACAATIHPTMTIFGIFHWAFLTWDRPRRTRVVTTLLALTGLAAASLTHFLRPIANPIWWDVVGSRAYLFPMKWPWYAWVYTGIVFAALQYFAHIARRKNLPAVGRVSLRVLWAGVVGLAGSLLITRVPALNSLVRLEPARALHLTFFLAVLLGGGLMGETVIHAKPRRWLLWLMPITLLFLVFNQAVYSGGPRVEWPGRLPGNSWVEAFDWIRRNTPTDTLFALNPAYMKLPGEDRHGFRAFAERSVLADSAKDRSVTGLNPELAFQWRLENHALESWSSFDLEDFLQLKKGFRVQWVVLEQESKISDAVLKAFSCPYQRDAILVCQIP